MDVRVQAFRGEHAAGLWTVSATDADISDPITVYDVVLTTYGHSSTDDRFIFTDEYSDFDGNAGHGTAVSDTNGGADTVNASAVSSNSTICLNGITGLIDGVAVTFSNIENAVGGDGNDILVGDSGANELWGMRGKDILDGGGGIDKLVEERARTRCKGARATTH